MQLPVDNIDQQRAPVTLPCDTVTIFTIKVAADQQIKIILLDYGRRSKEKILRFRQYACFCANHWVDPFFFIDFHIITGSLVKSNMNKF
jgi:hypothetical protein